MITRFLIKEYIKCCTFCGSFENDYLFLSGIIMGMIFSIVIDIVSSPIQILALLVGKIIEKKIN